MREAFRKVIPSEIFGDCQGGNKNILANGERKINEPCEGAARRRAQRELLTRRCRTEGITDGIDEVLSVS